MVPCVKNDGVAVRRFQLTFNTIPDWISKADAFHQHFTYGNIEDFDNVTFSIKFIRTKDKYFSFSWDSHKQPSGVASKFSRNDMSLQEEEPIIGMGKDLIWKPPESKKNPALAREEGGVDKHFSFTWQHKESTW